jgi:hypothetical protein
LGPCLLSVFIDNLEVEMERRKLDVLIVKFADDTKGAKVIQNPAEKNKMQEALDCLCEWTDRWGMSFNIAKFKVMHVGKNNPEYAYTMRGVKLSKTEEERDIGHWGGCDQKSEAKCPVQQNGGTSNDSAESNTPKFPLQGPAYIPAAIQAICATCDLT